MTAQLTATDSRLSFLSAGRPAGLGAHVVGAKAAGLMRMAEAGLPVPPGFVLSTATCADYHARGGRLGDDVVVLVRRGIEQLERATGRSFGAGRKPLLVAVRSGAPVSMPGMLDTMLDVGLCDSTLGGLLRATGDMRFVWDSYRRLIESYAEVVDGCEPSAFSDIVSDALRQQDVPAVAELDAAGLRDVVGQLQDRYPPAAGRPFPQDPMDQLLGAVEGVLRSWNSPRAVEYRRLKHLTGLPGTAVVVQAMVFGNTGMSSGAGVGFTRDPATGRPGRYVDFLLNAQGEDVVSGRTAVADSGTLIAAVPGLAAGLDAVTRKLESIFTDAQDFEFTVEDSKLWLLQTRTATRTPWAALQIACDLVAEGVIDEGTAVRRLAAYDLDAIAARRLPSGGAIDAVGAGVPASAGTVAGRVALTVADAQSMASRGEPVILVRGDASTDDIAALEVCAGLLTAAGARTSHAAVVARELGVACLVGCPALVIDEAADRLAIGDWQGSGGDFITIDGGGGAIYPGALELVEDRPAELVERVRGWQRRE